MTSNQFDMIARAAVAAVCVQNYGEEYDARDIQVVWFAHVLGNKKTIMIANGPNNRIYEVTYNAAKDELYVDAYSKTSNTVVRGASEVLMMEEDNHV